MQKILNTSYLLLIAINVAILLVAVVLNLFGVSVEGALMLPANPGLAFFKPWTLVTYMFTHVDIMHMLCNMTWLYFFGKLLCEYEGNRHTYAAYLTSGVIGGLAFILLCSIRGITADMLTGASAAILGVMTVTAVLMPKQPLNLVILGEVKLIWVYLVAILLVFLSSPQIAKGSIPTSDIAHIAGIASGAIYGILLKKGLIKLSRKKFVLYSRDNSSATKKDTLTPKEELNQLLDKVRRSGYASLSSKEKSRLVELSKQLQNN